MKLLMVLYYTALWVYAIAALQAFILNPVIYLMSLVYVVIYGVLSLAIFSSIFLVLRLTRPKVSLAITILVVAIIPSVGLAYKALNKGMDDTRNFWAIDEFTIFPTAALIAGWVSIWINYKLIIYYFDTLNFQKQLKHSSNNTNQTT